MRSTKIHFEKVPLAAVEKAIAMEAASEAPVKPVSTKGRSRREKDSLRRKKVRAKGATR
ncbi:MAG TPA: hypothetical protein VN025_06385 [Candidatus Dormibacteraeota bacterium]|jgi:hypothetical protein|nr:hypothetical protein [Candidatus Dormibacteraeota bacterium]